MGEYGLLRIMHPFTPGGKKKVRLLAVRSQIYVLLDRGSLLSGQGRARASYLPGEADLDRTGLRPNRKSSWIAFRWASRKAFSTKRTPGGFSALVAGILCLDERMTFGVVNGGNLVLPGSDEAGRTTGNVP